jgi:hypothetical protein
MELFKYLFVILIIVCIILLILYFNEQIQILLFNNYVEKFSIDDNIGRKWLYLGNQEPSGDKISSEKLYILLNYKWISPIVISVDELDSSNIKDRLSYNSYIDIDGRYFKPYNSSTDNYDIGLTWRNLGNSPEPHIKKYYNEIQNDKLKKELEEKMKAKSYTKMDGEEIYVFTKEKYDILKNDNNLTYDSYIIVGDNKDIFQPYYKHKIITSRTAFTDKNIDNILRRGFDNTYLRSSAVKTHNYKKDEYFNTEIYDNKGVSNNEIHFSTETENYRQSNDDSYKSILDPIDDKYLPYIKEQYNEDAKYLSEKAINEYAIIEIYKDILERHPRPKELIVNLQDFYEQNSDEEKLKLRLYNSTEYKMLVKLQSNMIDSTLISNISEKNIIDYLINIYNEYHNKFPHDKMKIPLKQCYIHLQFNDYLFRAMLMHDNYFNFEKSILREYIINDEKLLEIFNNNFVLYELRLIANELKRRDILKRKALTTPIALSTDYSKNAANSSNSDDTNLNSEKYIADIMKNDPVFNINIVMQDKNSNSGGNCSDDNKEKSSNLSKNSSDTTNSDDKCNRIYDPITYKQHYRGPMEYRPNVCSYGTKQVVNPLYLNSPGTELKEAIENTQVGSIMPKFIYREYEDITK